MPECVVEGCDRPQEFEDGGECIAHAAESWVRNTAKDRQTEGR